MDTIINVMQSLVKMNDWTVTGFDIQRFTSGNTVGYLTIEDFETTIKIQQDGSFEAITE